MNFIFILVLAAAAAAIACSISPLFHFHFFYLPLLLLLLSGQISFTNMCVVSLNNIFAYMYYMFRIFICQMNILIQCVLLCVLCVL